MSEKASGLVVKLRGKGGIQFSESCRSGPDWGEDLREAIRQSPLSEYALAKVSGVGQPTINNFMRGFDVRTKTFEALASAMGFRLTLVESKAPKKVDDVTKD